MTPSHQEVSTSQKNEIIRIWMGDPLCDCKQKKEKHLRSGLDFKDLKYHSSWDWLMPACKKWDDLDVFKYGESTMFRYSEMCDELDHLVSCYEIIPAFECLVKCIQWHNSLTQK